MAVSDRVRTPTSRGRGWRRLAVPVVLTLLGAGWALAQAPEMPLHTAALLGDLAAVRQHIAAGTDLDAADAYGSTPLIIAATFGHTPVLVALLDGGADPDATNAEGSTALHTAAFLGREDAVGALLDAGANRYLRNHAGHTARSSVLAPFEEVAPVYDDFRAGLGPLGLTLDDDHLRQARPRIAAALTPPAADLARVDYAPQAGGTWPISTPEAEGLDPDLVAEAYLNAEALAFPYAALVVRHGNLVAEGYFNGGAIDRKTLLQSVTKSFTSALVGLALREGCLTDVEQPMLAFFPEAEGAIVDDRKRTITVRQMLQMRAGYPWEETDEALWGGCCRATTCTWWPTSRSAPIPAPPSSTAT